MNTDSKILVPLTDDFFRAFVGKEFRVFGAQPPFSFHLADIKTYPRIIKGLRQPFTLIFFGPPGLMLPEGTYVLETDGQPGLPIHVQPMNDVPGVPGRPYQAQFN